MKTGDGMLLCLIALVVIAGTAPTPSSRSTGYSRYYWPTTVDTMALGRRLHTHQELVGVVDSGYPRVEADSDVHFRLKALTGSGRYIIGECIPLLPGPCVYLRARRPGDTVRIRGITRLDPEHGWREIHPIEWSGPR